MSDSCFVQKMKYFLALTDSEQEALSTIEDAPKFYEPGEVIFSEEEDTADYLYIVQEGRLHTSTILADGARALLRLSFPGDFLGMSSIPFDTAVSTAVVAAPASLCRFPRTGLTKIFEEHPRIAALFYTVAMIENVSMQDRLRSIGRTEGKARVGALILEVLSRLRITNPEMGSKLDLKMTQADIGDAIGLTNIHVSRCLRQLNTEGLLIHRGAEIEILQEEALTRMAHFTNRYEDISTDWFPAPR